MNRPRTDNNSTKPQQPSIPYARQSIDEADIAAVVAALRSDFVTQGPCIERFEAALQEVTGARFAVAVSSGTAALHLACQGLDLGAAHYGVVPAITFAATANCLRYVGSEVVFCDVEAGSGKATRALFEAALATVEIDRRLGAFLPVSLSGAVPELPELAELAQREGAYLIEDAAHSLGATYQDATGKAYRSGSCAHSDAAILSFHPVKHVCAGEGGALLTNDETLARRARRLRSHGVERGEDWLYDQVELGSHYRMTEMQAALGASQLQKLDKFVARRRHLSARYIEAFRAEPFASRLRVANVDEGSSRHLFVVHFSNSEVRELAYRFLRERGIYSQVHYFPVYRHSYYKQTADRELPGAEAYYSTCLSLPLYPALDDEQQTRVVDELRRFFGR